MKKQSDKASNKKPKNILKLSVLAIAIVILAILIIKNSDYGLSGLFKKDQDPILKTPISVPFDITKKGNQIEFFMKPRETYGYRFRLEFWYNDPRDSKYQFIENIKSFFPAKKYSQEELKEILKDSDRVAKLAGVGELTNGKWVERPAIPTPVKLTIVKLQDNQQQIVFEEVLEAQEPNAGYRYFHKTLTAEPLLLKGIKYKIIAESMKDSPELIGTEIHLSVINDRPK